MTRYSIIAILSIVASLVFLSCQSELEDRYFDEHGTQVTTIDKLFTGMLDNNRVRPSYWEISTFMAWHIGVYSQSVGFLNSPSVYQQNEAYIQDRWDDYYKPGTNGAGVVSQFREMEKLYAAMPEAEQQQWTVFLQAATIVLGDQTAQMVDLWGDIPFSQAGSLNNTGEVIYPPFDRAADIYDDILNDLKTASDYFATAALTSKTQSLFAKQDILLGGDLSQWRRYCNALRLRLLMRISFVDEARAKREIELLLHDPEKYPLLQTLNYNPASHDILLMPLADYTDGLHNAFTDWTNYQAPYFLLEQVLKPSNDPRIPVLFDKYGTLINNTFTPNEEYNAISIDLPGIEQEKKLAHYAILDSSTFLYNAGLPGIVMTAAEVSFLKAEAFERWGGGNAQQAYEEGIRQSIAFYYYLNSLGHHPKPPLPGPSAAVIDAFLAGAVQYAGTEEDKLALIGTQKWVHFGFLQSVQSWAEIRRTNYPNLVFTPAALSGYELPPTRLTYPINEKSFNQHYYRVAPTDQRNTKIFWDVN